MIVKCHELFSADVSFLQSGVATRSVFDAVLSQRSSNLAAGGGEQQPCGDVVEAAVTWADALRRLPLVVGEVLGGGPDRALLPAVSVQPRAGRLQAVFEDVECASGALELPAPQQAFDARRAARRNRGFVPTGGVRGRGGASACPSGRAAFMPDRIVMRRTI